MIYMYIVPMSSYHVYQGFVIAIYPFTPSFSFPSHSHMQLLLYAKTIILYVVLTSPLIPTSMTSSTRDRFYPLQCQTNHQEIRLSMSYQDNEFQSLSDC